MFLVVQLIVDKLLNNQCWYSSSILPTATLFVVYAIYCKMLVTNTKKFHLFR